jgi:uncharacterized Fe-S radical SAM superfamily protein PflX
MVFYTTQNKVFIQYYDISQAQYQTTALYKYSLAIIFLMRYYYAKNILLMLTLPSQLKHMYVETGCTNIIFVTK